VNEYNVPKGWALMPMEATPEMEQAAEKYWNERRFKSFSADPRTWQGVYAAMRAAAPAAPVVQGEPVEIDYPEFHEQGMGCGLEDRGITDRYEAMRYGWDEALDRVAEIIDGIGPLYAAPPAHLDAPRCQCCGYLVTESEHRGCLRSASPHPDASVLVEALESAIKAFEEIQGGCATDRDICREEAAKIRAALAGKGGAQ